MASAIRSKRDGMGRLAIIFATCEARDNKKKEVLAKWNGMLNDIAEWMALMPMHWRMRYMGCQP